MTFWEEAFEEQQIFLRNFTIDPNTGEFVGVLFDAKARRDTSAVKFYGVSALETYFENFGLDFRDIEVTESPRPDPLPQLLEVRGHLAPFDTATPLQEALTKEVENDLYRLAYADCKTRARAIAVPVHHHGLYVNTVITLLPCQDAAPFEKRSLGGAGTYTEPECLADGTFRFALSRPFPDPKDLRPVEEADAAAWQIGAVLMEYVATKQA